MSMKTEQEIESKGIISQISNAATSTANTCVSSWEAFGRVKGFLTDFISSPINIPSTAFTPAFQLPTKQAFSQVIRCISYAGALLSVGREIDKTINGDDARKKQDEIIMNNISKGFGDK